MENIKSKISNFGILIAVFGLVSIILAIFNYNLRILLWIDLWGAVIGWVIRIGLVISGVLLYILLSNKKQEANS